MSATDDRPDRPLKAVHGSPLLGMAPRVVFSIVAKRAHVEHAAIAAFVASLIITFRSVGAGESPKVLDVGALIAFAGLAVAGGLVDPHEGDVLSERS